MTCDDIRPRLTAYLDGDLDPDRGTVVRGHLRTCDACRTIAEQEAVLRDGLRDLPTVDPPSAMWSSIQAQLAAAEISESRRPAWKRALARQVDAVAAWLPALPRFAMGGVLAAAAVGILYWRTHESPEPAHKLVDAPSPKIEASAPVAIAATPGCNLDAPAHTDVTTDLAGEPARVTACYAQATAEWLSLVPSARAAWTDDQRTAFDAQLAELQKSVDDAPADSRARQRAYRALNRYLQNALTRDQVALASTGTR